MNACFWPIASIENATNSCTKQTIVLLDDPTLFCIKRRFSKTGAVIDSNPKMQIAKKTKLTIVK